MTQDELPTPEDLEAAYLRALDALENAEDAFAEVLNETAEEIEEVVQLVEAVEPAAPLSVGEQLDGSEPRPHVDLEPQSDGQHAVTPLQIIEAALFVGGKPLTTRNLRTLFRGDVGADDLVDLIDELNRLYASENRPYEVRLHEGGYVLELREEHQALRRRVFGLGPREVRLTQEALEVLALVAYHQPITREEIQALGKEKAGGVLRHLLRRELVQLEREEGSGEVRYRTTPRFLQLVGIRDLDDLPRADALTFK